ncbi:uncharacterized protein GGS25DRAFT_467315 [Hypoxylon fragiforme]|uniref:uncharacterized protein n=1 Tax=Hypoxylon fragiforme TaxID=63214 RepID=UPI0020C60184|nr:uncharacterized protein GGS25DRAFT_467315 [Hypoxylon fragiforme]KAI2613475.1 hypothetical protein GGS25DRAFT_467315 [Hypoxylon fragiforme]
MSTKSKKPGRPDTSESSTPVSQAKQLGAPNSKARLAVKDMKSRPRRDMSHAPANIEAARTAAVKSPRGSARMMKRDSAQPTRHLQAFQASTKMPTSKATITKTVQVSQACASNKGPRDPYEIPSDDEADNTLSTLVHTRRNKLMSQIQVARSKTHNTTIPSTPPYPSAKAIGKRSSHSINGHLNIVDIKTRDGTQVLSNIPSTDEKSKGRVYEQLREKPHKDGDGQLSPTPSKEINKSNIISIASGNPQVRLDDYAYSRRRSDVGKLMRHGQPNLSSPGLRSSSSSSDRISGTDKTCDVVAQRGITESVRGISSQNPFHLDGRPGDISLPRSQNSKAIDRQNSITPKAAIEDVKKTTKIKFAKKRRERDIPDAFFKEPQYSDDEYRPLSSNGETSNSDSGEDSSLSRRSLLAASSRGVMHAQPAQAGPNPRPRNGLRPKPTNPFTPINKSDPKAKEPESASKLSMKLGRAYPKHVRDIFSDGYSSAECDDDDDDTKKQKQRARNIDLDNQQDSAGIVAEQPVAGFERKPWWEPLKWIKRYETDFVSDSTGRLWLADGPYKGWIWAGPGAGCYIPNCHAPDDAMLAKAEETAIRNPTYASSYFESESEEHSSSELEDSEGHDTVKGAGSDKLAIERPISSTHQNRVVMEKEARMRRTEQYVLNSSSSVREEELNATQDLDSTCSTTRDKLPSTFAPTTPLKRTPSPPSAVSETTSILITRQLMNDCAPPSNQELAELMSSSPMKHFAKDSSPIRKCSKKAAGNSHMSSNSSSSESSSGIPAWVGPKRSPQPVVTSRKQDTPSLRSESSAMYIMNGIAERRTTRRLQAYQSPVVESSQSSQIASQELPTSLEDSQIKTAKRKLKEPKGRRANRVEPSWKDNGVTATMPTHVEVMLPRMATEERAEYAAISPVEEDDKFSTPSPKSFKEINKSTSRDGVQFSDSDIEELNYVLRQSPRWLKTTTNVDETTEKGTNMLKSPFAPLAKSSLKHRSLAHISGSIASPRTGKTSSTPDPNSLKMSSTSIPGCGCIVQEEQKCVMNEKPQQRDSPSTTRPTTTINKTGERHGKDDKDKRGNKRKTSSADASVLVDEPVAPKRQKMEEPRKRRPRKKKRRPNKKARRRLQRAAAAAQQQ